MLRVNKKISAILAIALFIAALAAGAACAESLSLWYGDIKKGDISARTNSLKGKDVAIEEVISALGLVRSGNLQGIVVVIDGKKMEFWNNSSVVRVNGSIISLPYPIEVKDGHWWADSKTMITVLDQFYTNIGRKPGMRWSEPDVTPPRAEEPKKGPAKEEPPKEVPAEPEKPTKAEITEPEKPAAEETRSAAVPASVKIGPGGKKPVVVIDAGHGGHDPGAMANGVREKDINLKAALELGRMLEEYGLDVRYTRKTDVYLKLAERTALPTTTRQTYS